MLTLDKLKTTAIMSFMQDTLLILGSLITIFSTVPYIIDIIKGKTKPNIATWITWFLLTSVVTIAEFAAGEYRTAIFTTTAVIETVLVITLGLKHGHTHYSKFDTFSQIAALFSFILWAIFNTPLAAIFFSILIDSLGALPTIRHSWQAPNEETWQAFALAGLGSFIAIFSYHQFNWTSLSYSVYLIIANSLISSVIIYRRAKLVNLKK